MEVLLASPQTAAAVSGIRLLIIIVGVVLLLAAVRYMFGRRK